MDDQFDAVITAIHDQLIALHQFTRHARPSGPYFDHDCRDAKRLTRRLGRAHAAAV
jgi:hypothetical protein